MVTARRAFSVPDPSQILTSPGGLLALLHGRTDGTGKKVENGSGAVSRRGGRPIITARDRSGNSSSQRATDNGLSGDNLQVFLERTLRSEAFLLAVIIFALSALWQFLENNRGVVSEKLRSVFSTTLEVRSSQAEFAMLMDWMARQPRGQRTRNIALRPMTVLDEPNGRRMDDTSNRSTFVPGYGSHLFFFKGTPVWITRAQDRSKEHGLQAAAIDRENDILTITLLTRHRADVTDFLSAVRESWRSHVRDTVQLYQYDYGWKLFSERSRRPLRTLYLPPDVKDVAQEIRAFLDLRDTYVSLGIPWRRGYLFDGPPGTGKSSFVLALASELLLPIHVLPLQSDLTDNRLLHLFAELPPRCIVLLEDLENALPTAALEGCPGGTRSTTLSSTSNGSRLSLSGLLNAIDGVASSEGRILIITANSPAKIPSPESLLRPGRIDRHVHFRKMERPELVAMHRSFQEAVRTSPISVGLSALQEEQLTPLRAAPDPVTPAEFQQELLGIILRQHLEATTAEKPSP